VICEEFDVDLLVVVVVVVVVAAAADGVVVGSNKSVQIT